MACALAAQGQIRIGIIGTDTSHVPAFTKLLNDPSSSDHIPGAKVVAAYKGGSKDVESSHTRVDKYAEEISSKYGVEIVPDIPALLTKVDAVLIEIRQDLIGDRDGQLAWVKRLVPALQACA